MKKFFNVRRVLSIFLLLSIAWTLYAGWYKIAFWGFDLRPDATTDMFMVDAHITFKAHGKPVKVVLSTPHGYSKFKIFNEKITAKGYHVKKDENTGRITLSSPNRNGEQNIYYRLMVYDTADSRGKVRQEEKITIQKPIFDDEQMIVIDNIFEQAQNIEGNEVQQLISLFNQTPLDENVQTLLPVKATRKIRAELLIDLLALKNISARLVHGVRLIEGKKAAMADLMLEAYDGYKWRLYDLQTGHEGLPKNFMVFQRGNVSLLDVEGGVNSKIRFSVLKSVTSSFEMAEHRAKLSSTDKFFTSSVYALPLWAQNVLKTLMVFPLGILVVVLMRNVVGVPTMGTFTPMLIAMSLIETGFVPGLICFVLIVAVGLILRRLLATLNLLLVPRIASVVIFVILIIQVLAVIGYHDNVDVAMSALFFPIIITAWIIERLSIIYEEEGFKNAMSESFYTLLTAIATYFVIKSDTVRHITFAFNEINLVILFLVMLLGTYTGYRLTELKRFYPLLKRK
ncbi:MAG: UUP1 family membrane protein [Alphaproteobacteria bacterium]|nr:UUP1 family membrane protein [Alphaproteobacteria bacterium]